MHAFAFDKTGTLTTGHAEVTGIWTPDGDEAGFLTALAGLAAHSEHPIGRAIRAEASRRALPPGTVHDVRASPSEGITGHDDLGPLWPATRGWRSRCMRCRTTRRWWR